MTLSTLMDAPARAAELEIWWQAHPSRWPHVPQGHFIGPDGRVLSPAEFAAYGRGRRIVVIHDEQAATSAAGCS